MLNKEIYQMTLGEFEKLEQDSTQVYELFEGVLTMQARPGIEHSDVMMTLSAKLFNQLSGSGCKVNTEIELKVNDNTVVVPDILVGCEKERYTEQRYEGTPKIIVEIISPSNRPIEMLKKYNYYLSVGAEEYWIVDLKTKTIQINNFVDDYMYTYSKEEVLCSKAIEGFSLSLNEVF